MCQNREAAILWRCSVVKDGWGEASLPSRREAPPRSSRSIPSVKPNAKEKPGEGPDSGEWPKNIRRDLAPRRLGRDASPHPAYAARHISGRGLKSKWDRAFGTFAVVKMPPLAITHPPETPIAPL